MAISLKSRRAFHPAVSILSWLTYAVAVELYSPQRLVWLALPAIFLILHKEASSRFLRLLWKLKWLLLTLLLLFAFTLPGVYVWQGNFSPTYEGLQMGGLRIARLTLLVMALARLLVEFPPHQIASGLYVLTGPFEGFGFDRRGLAVRLALTLEQMETRAPNKRWLAELRSASRADDGPEQIRVVVPAVNPYDVGLLLMALALLAIGLL